MAKLTLENFKKEDVQKSVEHDMRSFEELVAEAHGLNEEYRKLIDLPDDEFLAKENMERRDAVRSKLFSIAKALLRK